MRILKHTALIFSYLIAFSSFAQKEITTIDFPYRSMQHFEFSKNQNGDYCLFVNKNEFYYFCYISKKGEKVYDTTIKEYSSIKPAFLGVKPTTDSFIYYFLPAYAKRKLKTITVTQNINDCKEQSGFEFFSSKKEKIIKSASFGYEFYLVTANKKASSIYVSRFNNKNGFDKKEFKVVIGKDVLKKNPYKTSNSIIGDLLSTDFSQAGFNNLNLIQSNSDGEKLIIDGSNLHFTLKKGDIVSLLWDNETFKYNYRDDDLPNNHKDYNFFVLNEKVYTIILSPDELFLKVYELNNGSLIKQFHYSKDDEFDLPVNPIKKHLKTAEGHELVDEIVKTNKILRKLSRGFASIYGYNDSDDRIHLFIGSYISDKGTWVPVPIPGTFPMVLRVPIPTGSNSSGNFISFETILSLPDLEIIHPNDDSNESYIYKLNSWSDTNLMDPIKVKVKFSESDTHLYVLQLFNNKKQLVITEFEK